MAGTAEPLRIFFDFFRGRVKCFLAAATYPQYPGQVAGGGAPSMSDLIWQAFLTERIRIENYALKKGRRFEKLFIRRGLDTGELEPHALINAVWEQIIEADRAGRTLWEPTQASIFEFFRNRIHNHIRMYQTRVTGEHLAIVATDAPKAQEITPEELVEADEGLRDLVKNVEAADVLQFLERHDPKVVAYANHLMAGLRKEEAGELLKVSAATRHRLQTKLKSLLLRYRDLAAEIELKLGRQSI